MPDEPDPPRKVYGFKERDFKRDNAPSSAAPPPPTVQELAKLAGHHHDPTARKTAPKADDPNDVYAVLERNRKMEQRHNLDAVEIKKVKSRKLRDFWLLFIGGNVLIVGSVVLLGANVVSVLFGFGGVIIFSISLTWIMWQVMDRY